MSGHLSCLRDCGLAAARAEVGASLYSLARPELPTYGLDTGP